MIIMLPMLCRAIKIALYYSIGQVVGWGGGVSLVLTTD